jgi:hypothetical protein
LAGGVLLVLACVLVFAGCASRTRIFDMWKDPSSPSTRLKNVLVVAVKKDTAARRIWEDGFVERFSERGVSTTPSYRLFPDARPDTAQVVEAVREQGFDTVVMIHRVQEKTVQEVTPGYVTTEPRTYLDPWTGVFHTYYEEVYYPGYVEDVEVVVHQIDVWSTADRGRLLWVGKAETYAPSSNQETNESVVKQVVDELADQGFLSEKKA